MTLQSQSSAHFRDRFGYADSEGQPSDREIANLLRAPLLRWGLSPKRAVVKHVRSELRAAGIVDPSHVPRVLQRLIELGECVQLHVGHEPHLAPTASRWIAVGEDVAAYLGVSDPPPGLRLIDTDHHDIVRRICLKPDETDTTLELAGTLAVSLAEWFVPPDYLRHASRRMRKPARSDKMSLADFWDLLEQALTAEGLPLSADAEVRILAGRQGGFFGKHDSSLPEGRWSTISEDGIWCAYRRGYTDDHWHPCIVAVTNNARRALDLYDADEWRWAVFARGRRLGAEEVVQTNGLKVQLTCPAPGQLRAAMNILGCPSGAWAWSVSPGAPDLWRLVT